LEVLSEEGGYSETKCTPALDYEKTERLVRDLHSQKYRHRPIGCGQRASAEDVLEVASLNDDWHEPDVGEPDVGDPPPNGGDGGGGGNGNGKQAAKLNLWVRTPNGAIRPCYANARMALRGSGLRFRHDMFHDVKMVDGDLPEHSGPQLSDAMCRALRDFMIARHQVDFGLENVQQAAERSCEVNRFDPVLDYLASLKWDGAKRLDRWLTTYLCADDMPLNRAFGRKFLVAMVRRAKKPGCKFDFLLVLEGLQGTGKSTLAKILAGEDSFTDRLNLHADVRAQQEAIKGRWLVEFGELAGMRKADVESLKSFLSATHDSCRAAYARFRSDPPRRCVFIGTTNGDDYLADQTGNRRFWPVKVGAIDLEGLESDRDQLFAEAAHAEEQGEPLGLPPGLYEAAGVEQEARVVSDPWEEALAEVSGEVVEGDCGPRAQVSSQALLSRLNIPIGSATNHTYRRLTPVMKKLGWERAKLRFPAQSSSLETPNTALGATVSLWGYWRQASRQ
jgi:hypothetical protein